MFSHTQGFSKNWLTLIWSFLAWYQVLMILVCLKKKKKIIKVSNRSAEILTPFEIKL